MPLSDWLTIEGQIENRKPSITFSNAPVAGTPLSEATAPGLVNQPDFMHYAAGFRTHFQAISEPVTTDSPVSPGGVPPPPLMKHKFVFVFDNNGLQHWYSDEHTGHYSFSQFVIDGAETVQLHSIVRRFVPPAQMTPFLRLLKHFCNERKAGLKVTDECDFGELRFHPFVVSSTVSGSHVIPFYLQPTLGGSDIESRPTLRGFDNYRFRAPDAAMLGVEYDMSVWNPIGALLFYDVGTVGNSFSDLSFGHARQDGGFGATLRLLNNVVAEVYLGYGAGHGSHFGYNFTKFF